jgi:hypothetical protein
MHSVCMGVAHVLVYVRMRSCTSCVCVHAHAPCDCAETLRVLCYVQTPHGDRDCNGTE